MRPSAASRATNSRNSHSASTWPSRPGRLLSAHDRGSGSANGASPSGRWRTVLRRRRPPPTRQTYLQGGVGTARRIRRTGRDTKPGLRARDQGSARPRPSWRPAARRGLGTLPRARATKLCSWSAAAPSRPRVTWHCRRTSCPRFGILTRSSCRALSRSALGRRGAAAMHAKAPPRHSLPRERIAASAQ